MTSAEWSEVVAEAVEDDPRENPYGHLTGGSFTLDSCRVFTWFPTVAALVKQLLEVQPRVYDLEPGAGLEEYQARVRPILARVSREGLTEEIRLALRPEIDGAVVVDWWGNYEDLREGKVALGRDLLDEFLGDDRAGDALSDNEEAEFVEYLQTCRV